MRTIAQALTSWGPPGLFLLAILDSAGVPLPAAVDALLVATAAVSPSRAYIGAAFAVAGSVIGCMILFGIGRKGGGPYLDRVTAKRGARFRQWFREYGLITVFIPALVPIPMPVKVFVLSAGALGVRPISFLCVVVAARIPRYFGLAFLGAQLGEGAGAWLKQHVWELAGFAAALAVLLAVLARALKRRET